MTDASGKGQPTATLPADHTPSSVQPRLGAEAVPAERTVAMQYIQETHVGPLPPARELERYGQVDPDAPGIILAMAQKQQQHVHFIEKGELISETVYRVFGMLSALAVVGGIVGGAVYCAINGHETVGAALGASAGLACVAGVFVRGRNLTRMQDAPEHAQQAHREPTGSTTS